VKVNGADLLVSRLEPSHFAKSNFCAYDRGTAAVIEPKLNLFNTVSIRKIAKKSWLCPGEAIDRLVRIANCQEPHLRLETQTKDDAV
jgi:hypothetical protein